MNILEQERELARLAGVGHPENLPFLLTPERANGGGVLLVHGFTATPREMRELGEHLCAAGFTVYGVRLPGHGTSSEDLATRSWLEWLATVLKGHRLLSELGLQVHAAGLSTGALLVLMASLRRPCRSLVLLSPYLRLKHPLAPCAALFSRWIPYQLRHIPASEQAYYYPRRPLKGIAQLNRLRRVVKRRLGAVTTPCLVLTSTGDQTIAPGSAQALLARLSGTENRYHCYGPEVPHVLTTAENPCQQDVFRRISDFLTLWHRAPLGSPQKDAAN